MLFHFQIFGDFPESFLLRISNLTPRDEGCVLYIVNPFQFIRTCFMAQNVVCLGTCFVSTLRRGWVLLFCLESSIKVNPAYFVDTVAQVCHVLADFPSACSVRYGGRCVEISDYNCGWDYFCFHFCQLSLRYFDALFTGA